MLIERRKYVDKLLTQETFSLRNTGDFYRRVVVLDGSHKLWTDEDGVIFVGVIPFLLDDEVYLEIVNPKEES